MINLQIQWRCHSCRINGCVTKPELEENYTYYTLGGCVTITDLLQVCLRIADLVQECVRIADFVDTYVIVTNLVAVSQQQNQWMCHKNRIRGCITIITLLVNVSQLQICCRYVSEHPYFKLELQRSMFLYNVGRYC